MNPHWDAFTGSVPWFVEPGQHVTAGPPEPPGSWKAASPAFPSAFPRLDELLRLAHVSRITVAERPYLLFSWPTDLGTPAWLCAPPGRETAVELHADHDVLLSSFGGIVERADEPDSWLLNHAEALTEAEARHDASFLSDYAWAFEGRGIPIETSAFYSVAREANGNTTLCHRRTGEVLLFAPDHSFSHVRRWKDCPEFTLYEIDGAPAFRTWVEAIATQWLDAARRTGGGRR